MKANKKGISLIVLIITIVVIIILAAAIILNLSKTNVITNANTAVKANDLSEVQSAVNLKYGDIFSEKLDQPLVSEIIGGYTYTDSNGNSQIITGLSTDLPNITLNAAVSTATEESATDAKKTFWLGTNFVVYNTLADATKAGATETVSGT